MKRAERSAMWQRHVDAWRASGLSLGAYCDGKRLSRESMRRWRRRLALAPVPDSKSMSGSSAMPGALVPVRVCETAPPQRMPDGLIEIRLLGGRSMVVDAAVDEARLARLIGVVERAP
jgi:hypothetical protein